MKEKDDFKSFDQTLIQFSPDAGDAWRIEDALKGISIMGGTGSGKTSASGKALALTFLKQGWGGLVLCAKTDEAKLWEKYCKAAGREEDVIIFSKNSIHKKGVFAGEKMVFNPIEYESKRKGEGAGDTLNITNIFMNIYSMGNRIASEGDTKEERYWDTALRRCLNRVIEILKLAHEDLSYSNMVKIINSSNNVKDDSLTKAVVVYDQQGQIPIELEKDSHFCLKCLLSGYLNYYRQYKETEILTPEANGFELVEAYFTEALPTMSSKTKSVVTESFMGLAEPFLSGMLYQHFSGKSNIFPEQIYEENKIIILDFSIKEHLDAGIIAQCMFKLLFQQAIERRDTTKYPLPVFLWCDEAQYFVNSYDHIFLTTARSSRTSTVYLSQNISNYFAVMGSGSDAKARVDSLMGNLSTKIFHANSDAETNEYASRLIGDEVKVMNDAGISHPHFSLEKTESEGVSTQYLPQVQPKEFTVLKTGGHTNDLKVEAIINVAGREWVNGKNYIKVRFTQKF